MNTPRTSSSCSRFRFGFHQRPSVRAFTLIELLVVIAIIAILAALLFPAGAAVKRKATIKRVEGEVAQIATAIESYKIDKGFYPPDNRAGNPVLPYPNSLYYELSGANYDRARDEFVMLSDGEVVAANLLDTTFNTRGINNAGSLGNTEGLVAKNYLPDLKPIQHDSGPGGLQILGTTVEGPILVGDINPFQYVSSSPTNNASSFDLWVDIFVSGKTNRISNWSDEREIVSY